MRSVCSDAVTSSQGLERHVLHQDNVQHLHVPQMTAGSQQTAHGSTSAENDSSSINVGVQQCCLITVKLPMYTHVKWVCSIK